MDAATPPTPYVLVQLQAGEKEYENISRKFVKDKISVTKIERLENTFLSDEFNSELKEMTIDSPDLNLNIRPLYHCTCIEKSRICEEGLSQTMSRTGDFGNGFYFSDSPIKCLHHSEIANHPERAMVLRCLVILGDSAGSQSDLTQYVVYQYRRVKVEYIITFAVDEETKELIQSMPIMDMSRPSDEKIKKSNSKAWKYVAVGVGLGAVGVVATPFIASAALGAVGFTSGGVAAGSTAAAIQATLGNVAAGSAFAMAQSAAATGTVSVGTQLAGGTIFGAASTAVMKLFKNKTQKADASQEK